jgi:hypothetical protein
MNRISELRVVQCSKAGAVPMPAVTLPGLFALAASITLAGLVWLGLSGYQAAAGRQISRLDGQRQELLEQRVVALLRQAEASDPSRLEARALELGFMPVGAASFEPLPVADPELLRAEGPIGPESPLYVALSAAPAGGIPVEPDDLSSLLMSLGAAAPASADELASETTDLGR